MTYDVIARAGRSRRRRRLRTLVLAGGVAALIACVSVLALRPTPPTTAQPRSGVAAVASSPTIPAATSSAQPDPGTTGPMPADLAWTHVSGVAVPVSGSDGPDHQVSGLASGFSHDRAGAVLAATNLLLRLTPQVGPAVFAPTLRTQVSGPNTAALTEQVNAQYRQLCAQAGVAPGGPVGGLTATYVGYTIQLYSDATVLLTVLTEAARAGQAPLYIASVIQLAWVDRDWALVAPTGGVWDQSITEVAAADIGTFNPFTAGR
jgi:hypothetical protein